MSEPHLPVPKQVLAAIRETMGLSINQKVWILVGTKPVESREESAISEVSHLSLAFADLQAQISVLRGEIDGSKKTLNRVISEQKAERKRVYPIKKRLETLRKDHPVDVWRLLINVPVCPKTTITGVKKGRTNYMEWVAYMKSLGGEDAEKAQKYQEDFDRCRWLFELLDKGQIDALRGELIKDAERLIGDDDHEEKVANLREVILDATASINEKTQELEILKDRKVAMLLQLRAAKARASRSATIGRPRKKPKPVNDWIELVEEH